MLRNLLFAAFSTLAIPTVLIVGAPPGTTTGTTTGIPHALPTLGSIGAAEVAPGALERVAVIGASASAGFLLPTDLGEAIELLIDCEHEPVLRVASSRFFTDPLRYGENQIRRAQAREPTTVVAIDFLFWFTYGFVAREENRARLLERGLEFLDGFECPVLTSTVPDMRGAVGKMLWPGQVPAPETLDQLNLRIADWASQRSNVVLVSLPEWHAQLLSDEPFDVAGKRWPPTPGAPLLQYDNLHPNVDGISLIACKVLESLIEAGTGVDPQAVRLDPERVARPVHERMRAIVSPRRTGR